MSAKSGTYTFLDLGQAERFVKTAQEAGKDVFWDGWTIKIFTPGAGGFFKTFGAYRNGRWGTMRSIESDSNGRWRIHVSNLPVKA